MAFVSIGAAESAAEIEPFKTAITAKFTRAWPYVVYALALLAIGLFTERAYCRFLCPLGGVLAALDRFHLLDRLRRRAECGSPCRLCEAACPVRAIEKSGKIVTAECFQCLDCQVEYFDDQRCPPLVAARRLASESTARWRRMRNDHAPPRVPHPGRRSRPAAARRGRARDGAGRALLRLAGRGARRASELTLWHWDEALARRTILKVRHEIERYERIFSLYRDDSEIARLNRDGVLARPSPELVAVIDASQRLGTLSGGAFDISVQPLWRVYEAHFWSRSCRRARHRGARARRGAHAGGFSPHPAGSGAHRAPARHGDHAQRHRAGLHHRPHRRPAAQRRLRARDGRSRGISRTRQSSGWPRVARRDYAAARLALSDNALAVSSGSGTTFEPSGRFHHIFDPATGASANMLREVAVIAPRAMIADALATAICVAGEARGIELLAHYPGARALVTRAS